MKTYKTLNVSPEVFEDIEKLCKSYKLPKSEFLATVVNYLKATKTDPRNAKEVNTTDAIKAVEKKMGDLDRRIISFIKTQEKDLLKPILDEVMLIAKGKTSEHSSLEARINKIDLNLKIIAEALNRR